MYTTPKVKVFQSASNPPMQLFCLLALIACNIGFAQMHPEMTREKEIRYSGPGKITLETGVEVEGEITHSRITQRRVHVKKSDNATETYKIKEVKSFSIGGIFFEKITTPGLGIKDPDFAIVMSNPASKVRVYEVCWQEDIGTVTEGEITWPTHWEYYIYFPVDPKLKGPSDLSFLPFVKKVSKLVEDCPQVSNRIKAKEKGFSISLISTDDDKLNVFKNIANAYANCK